MPSYSGPMPRRHPFAVAFTAMVAAAVMVAGCSSGTDRSDARRLNSPVRPTTEPSSSAPAAVDDGLPPGWTPKPLHWTDCPDVGAGTQCATLSVPLAWSDPEGRTITLALARRPASGGSDRRIGSLLMNPGGPGGSGVDFVASGVFTGEVAERFDQVGWDPRGVARSEGLTCGEDATEQFLRLDPDPDSPQEQDDLDRAAAAVATQCATDAALLSNMGTGEVARDLEAIRLALDDGPLNYVGFSYGTQIGQEYAKRFPSSIRAIVLDGVVDPATGFTDFLMGQIDGFEAAFERNRQGCSANRVRCRVDDLAAAYDQMHARLEQQPLAVDGRDVGPAELATAAIYTDYGSDGWKRLGPALADALDGDGARLLALADGYHDLGGYASYAGVVCTDTPPPSSPAQWRTFADQARARSPRFGGSVANELLPCATWPVGPTAEPAAVTAPDAPPMLVVGNTGDPFTPLADARAVAAALQSGVLVTVDISGHTAYGRDRCATDVIDRYLIALAVPVDDTRCPG